MRTDNCVLILQSSEKRLGDRNHRRFVVDLAERGSQSKTGVFANIGVGALAMLYYMLQRQKIEPAVEEAEALSE